MLRNCTACSSTCLKDRIFPVSIIFWSCCLVLLPAHAQEKKLLPSISSKSEDIVVKRLQSETDTKRNAIDGFIIGTVRYNILEIFDTNIPEENTSLFRLANKLHILTKQSVIEDQLLFKSGNIYSQSQVDESERILRANHYLQNAKIRPAGYHDNIVDVDITTQDLWSLDVGASFGRKGGQSFSRINLEEKNFLGTGTTLGMEEKSGVDRDEKILKYSDRHLFGSRWSVNAITADNSDGYQYILDIEKPFYSLGTRNAGGINFHHNERIVPIYAQGEIIREFQRQQKYVNSYYSWSSGLSNGRVQRWTLGMTYKNNQFATVPSSKISPITPSDSKLIYPVIGFESIVDNFIETTNLNQIGRVEDIYVGTDIQTQLGIASTSFGSNHGALLLSGTAKHGFRSGTDRTIFLSGSMSAKIENGQRTSMIASSTLRFYKQPSPRRAFFIGLRADYNYSPGGEESQLLLGGDNGLRGYPLRYQTGNRLILLTLEQRYFSNWYPFRLFHVGGAIFFDAGRAWETASQQLEQKNEGVLKDVGFGLRLGNARSSSGNIIHIDLAFPLDGDPAIDKMQFLIETKQEF